MALFSKVIRAWPFARNRSVNLYCVLIKPIHFGYIKLRPNGAHINNILETCYIWKTIVNNRVVFCYKWEAVKARNSF